jgi:hypothetical protein
MIVFLKNALAQTLTEILENSAKIVTSGFNEKANKVQSQLDINVIYQGSVWSKNSQTRIFDYDIDIKSKDLRTDDSTQIIIDQICFGLLGANRFGNHLDIVSDSFEGYADGIWDYQIKIRLTYPNSLDVDNDAEIDAIEIANITVGIFPTFETDFHRPTGIIEKKLIDKNL